MYSLSIFNCIYIFPTVFHKNLQIVCRSAYRAMLFFFNEEIGSKKYKYLEIRHGSD